MENIKNTEITKETFTAGKPVLVISKAGSGTMYNLEQLFPDAIVFLTNEIHPISIEDTLSSRRYKKCETVVFDNIDRLTERAVKTFVKEFAKAKKDKIIIFTAKSKDVPAEIKELCSVVINNIN